MLYSAFTLSIIGTSLGALALLMFFLLQNKTKKINQLTIDILDLKDLIQSHSEKITQLESAIVELKTSQAEIITANQNSYPTIEIFSDDTQWTRTGKHWAQKAYENPETALSVVASTWKIISKLFK